MYIIIISHNNYEISVETCIVLNISIAFGPIEKLNYDQLNNVIKSVIVNNPLNIALSNVEPCICRVIF